MNPLTVAAETGTEVSPGILGFLVVAALGLTLYFLVRSMNKQISRIEAPREDDYAQAQRAAPRDREDGRQETARHDRNDAEDADDAEDAEDVGKEPHGKQPPGGAAG